MSAKKTAKKAATVPKAKRGRPSKFTEGMLKQARFLTARGCTDAELAEFFEVSVPTIDTWKKLHADFLGALKDGKAFADSAVERALYERATGYSHPDTHISNFQGQITATPMVKHYPPDTTAAIFWLKNRKPAEWRDKQDIVHEGEIRIVVGGDTA